MENDIFKRVHWDDSIKRRPLKELDAEIKRLEDLIQKHRSHLQKVEARLDKTRGLRARAVYQEAVSKDGIEVNVVEVNPTFGGWTAITDEGLNFVALKKPQIGKNRIAKELYDYIKKNP